MDKLIENTIGWQFMDEPLWRWVVFLIAMSFIAAGWRGTLNFMK